MLQPSGGARLVLLRLQRRRPPPGPLPLVPLAELLQLLDLPLRFLLVRVGHCAPRTPRPASGSGS